MADDFTPDPLTDKYNRIVAEMEFLEEQLKILDPTNNIEAEDITRFKNRVLQIHDDLRDLKKQLKKRKIKKRLKESGFRIVR